MINSIDNLKKIVNLSNGKLKSLYKNFGVYKTSNRNKNLSTCITLPESNYFNNLMKTLECPICLDIINHASIISPCNHIFCRDCICIWDTLNSKCPVCKTAINEKSCCKILDQIIENVKSIDCSINKETHSETVPNEIFSSQNNIHQIWVLEGIIKS